MIRLSNNHCFEYMVASGALGFDGQGWWYEKPLVAIGLIKPQLFTVVIRTLTLEPRLYPVSNLSWRRPWTWLPFSSRSCVQFLPNGGAVNKIGLYNPGIESWCKKIAPTIDFHRFKIVSSIFGERHQLVKMAAMLNQFTGLVGLEVNVSCMNTEHEVDVAKEVIESIRAVKKVSRHPIIVKVSVDQDYMTIAKALKGTAEAMSLNSVPWLKVFPKNDSPLLKIGKLGTGGGGVSGTPAQYHNWRAVKKLANQKALPVIAPSVMNALDVSYVRNVLRADAVSFGAIHLRTPWRPTSIVRREMKEV